ncbi:SDR family NAD(P)-dependent oxidoreductase [Nocardia xishanensis]|uniref:SDR family NAD(P)-dependent oxidoreductase n=1 Tax=Nocardia xishanensis TaxID=238964 RepID=UPI003F53F497
MAFAIRAELGVPGDAAALWAAFDAHADGLDILVNNAGTDGIREPIGGTDEAAFDRLFAINTKAPFFVTKLGLDRLRDGGRVINVSTGLTHGLGMPELIAYTMTKAAIDSFTAVLAKEVGARGITVNAVAPGVVDTDMNAGVAAQSGDRGGGRGVLAAAAGGAARRGRRYRRLPRLGRRPLGDRAVDRRDRRCAVVTKRITAGE